MTWWMILLLIFGILFLIGCIPVGVDAAYLGGSFTLKVKIWLLRLQLLPARPKKAEKGEKVYHKGWEKACRRQRQNSGCEGSADGGRRGKSLRRRHRRRRS